MSCSARPSRKPAAASQDLVAVETLPLAFNRQSAARCRNSVALITVPPPTTIAQAPQQRSRFPSGCGLAAAFLLPCDPLPHLVQFRTGPRLRHRKEQGCGNISEQNPQPRAVVGPPGVADARLERTCRSASARDRLWTPCAFARPLSAGPLWTMLDVVLPGTSWFNGRTTLCRVTFEVRGCGVPSTSTSHGLLSAWVSASLKPRRHTRAAPTKQPVLDHCPILPSRPREAARLPRPG